MSNVYISHLAHNKIKNFLIESGHRVLEVSPLAEVDSAISSHPDIYMCHLGKELFRGDPSKLTHNYPGHAIYNGCSTGKYFIHNLKITDKKLLNEVENLGLIKVDVRQGYAKCSCIVVDENSIITADKGIAKAANDAGLDVLVIDHAQVELEGYPYGFIGGATGKVGNVILFNGNLRDHSNYKEIKEFIERREVNIKYFEDYPLTDIGSIIEE
ncbi:MAG: hypothetical protein IKU67_01160 [Firmicutes bacterium]|nr:hypothetical protein [Bacillota bacterium]